MGGAYNQRGIDRDQKRWAEMTALVPSRSFSDGRNFPIERAVMMRIPQNGLNLTRFAYDRINGHNPRQSLKKSKEPMRA